MPNSLDDSNLGSFDIASLLSSEFTTKTIPGGLQKIAARICKFLGSTYHSISIRLVNKGIILRTRSIISQSIHQSRTTRCQLLSNIVPAARIVSWTLTAAFYRQAPIYSSPRTSAASKPQHTSVDSILQWMRSHLISKLLRIC